MGNVEDGEGEKGWGDAGRGGFGETRAMRRGAVGGGPSAAVDISGTGRAGGGERGGGRERRAGAEGGSGG